MNRDMEELKGLCEEASSKLEEIRERMARIVIPAEPELIQGYTSEQWQEIIDGGYLCEFSGSGNKSIGTLEYIKDNVYDDHPFQQEDDSDWSECRPAQIKGVMRPIFAEPVDKDASCVFFGQHGTPLHSNVRWGYELGVSNSKAAKYIEV